MAKVTVRVTDHGIGIAPEELDGIFERFRRGGNAASMNDEGLGLGLPVAKAIVEAHKGRIAMASRLGEGTTVTVASSGRGRGDGCVNVLLVEDEPRVADFIDRGLRAENYGVTVAPSGGQGVELAKTGEFDVIILDLMLPDMHGYDVCQRIRLEGDHTPILMLTAMDATEDKIKGLKAGVDDYLTKLFDFDESLGTHPGPGSPLAQFRPELEHLKVADLVLDRELLEVRRGSDTVKLTAKELAILELLMSAPGRAVAHPHPQPGMGR